jgi:hypothetical protein
VSGPLIATPSGMNVYALPGSAVQSCRWPLMRPDHVANLA